MNGASSGQKNVQDSLAAVVDVPKECECSVCLEPFLWPARVVPCGHVFCRSCILRLSRCPQCRANVAKIDVFAPSDAVVVAAHALKVRCLHCGWEGRRDASEFHHCTYVPASPKRTPEHEESSASTAVGHAGSALHDIMPVVVSQQQLHAPLSDHSVSDSYYHAPSSFTAMYPGWSSYDQNRYWEDPYYFARCGV